MVPSNILIWEPDFGFFKINEGNGSNLLEEDEAAGYVDYIMYEAMEYNGYDFTEIDGGQVMLDELYQEKFENEADVVQHLIDSDFIPDAEYAYLYAK